MKPAKFVIYGQSRSGSTLLVELLNTHPYVHCDGELFNDKATQLSNDSLLKVFKVFPFPYLGYRRQRATGYTYGFKLLFYHLPRARYVMRALALAGWRFIHIYRRNIVHQALSSLIAQETQCWHRRDGEVARDIRVCISVPQLRRELDTRTRWRMRENDLIRPIEHIEVCYEDDLEREADWLKTADRLARFLNLTPFVPGHIGLKRIVDRRYEDLIENFAELDGYLASRGEFIERV